MKKLREIIPLDESPVSQSVWKSVKSNAKYIPAAIPIPLGIPALGIKIAKDAYNNYKKQKRKKDDRYQKNN